MGNIYCLLWEIISVLSYLSGYQHLLHQKDNLKKDKVCEAGTGLLSCTIKQVIKFSS